MVHSSVRSLGPVIGGANTILHAILDVLGPTGTLTAYLDFEPFYEEDDKVDIPVFDKRIARAALDHGILHEAFRTWPGVLRSDHPDAGVAALGPLAPWITSPHPFHYGYGPGTPFARILEAQADILMLGAPLDTITLLHHAEHLAAIPGKRIVRYKRLMPAPGGPQWIDFEEFDTSDPVHPAFPQDHFTRIALDFLAAHAGSPHNPARHPSQGKVAQATAYLFPAAELIPFAIQWLEAFPLPAQ